MMGEGTPNKQSGDMDRITWLAFLVAVGVVFHRLEALLPLPSPWVKIGLANIATLIALVFFGFREAMMVTLHRVFLSSLLGGTFLSPTFLLSLIGGISATLAMGMVYRGGHNPFSMIGISITGAYVHTVSIVLCVYLVFARSEGFLKLLPVFLIFALFSSLFTGMAANLAVRKFKKLKLATH